MPNKNSPPKHKTPNWKLVNHSYQHVNMWGDIVRVTVGVWEPRPLRAGRKNS